MRVDGSDKSYVGLTRLGMHALATNSVRQHLGLSFARTPNRRRRRTVGPCSDKRDHTANDDAAQPMIDWSSSVPASVRMIRERPTTAD
jgi:hypothetical protein